MTSAPSFILPSTATTEHEDDTQSLVANSSRHSLVSARKVVTGMFLVGVMATVAVTLATARSEPTNKDNSNLSLTVGDAKAHLAAIVSQSHAVHAAKSSAHVALVNRVAGKQLVEPSISLRGCNEFSTCWECNSLGIVTGCKWADNDCQPAPVDIFSMPALDECSDVPETVREFVDESMNCMFEPSSCDSSVCLLRIQTSPELAGQPCFANILGDEPLLCNTVMAPGFHEQCLGSCDDHSRCGSFDTAVCQDYPPAGTECSMESCLSIASIMRCPRTCGLCNQV